MVNHKRLFRLYKEERLIRRRRGGRKRAMGDAGANRPGSAGRRSTARALLKPFDKGLMWSYPVSRAVNSVKNDTEECILEIGL